VNYQLGLVGVDAGDRATYTMLLIPIGGFAGGTTFTSYDVSAIPGASGSWSQTSLKGSGTVTFTVQTSSSTPAGNYPITLIARSGNMTRTATLELSVLN
jgi:serine protease AprX